VRDNGGHAVALKWAMRFMMGRKPGDRFWAASDFGWVVGHCFIVYAPLLSGLTTLVYEGKPVNTPDAGAFWRVCAEHRIQSMFTAPTALRAIKKDDPPLALAKKYDLSKLESVFLAGERADPETIVWAAKGLGKEIYDNWWQTETGWPIVSNQPGLERFPVKAGSATKPCPGFVVHVLDDHGERITDTDTQGNLALKLPLPPGTLQGLWKNEARFRKGYFERFPGYYDTADAGFIDADGYVHVMSRTDDVLNVTLPARAHLAVCATFALSHGSRMHKLCL
jgi:propionyl-CoA synthetase